MVKVDRNSPNCSSLDLVPLHCIHKLANVEWRIIKGLCFPKNEEVAHPGEGFWFVVGTAESTTGLFFRSLALPIHMAHMEETQFWRRSKLRGRLQEVGGTRRARTLSWSWLVRVLEWETLTLVNTRSISLNFNLITVQMKVYLVI